TRGGRRGHEKGAAGPRLVRRRAGPGPDHSTLKSLLCTTLPSSEISTLYWPAGKPSGLAMWNSVVPAPVKASSRLSSLTTWPSSNVHFAVSVPGTLVAGSLVLVATEA